MGALIKVEGLRQFTTAMRKMGAETLPKQIRLANLSISARVAERIASAAPRGKSEDRDKHPGKLARSTKPRATQRQATVQIGRNLDYAKPVIFGWKKHHITANKYPYEVLDAMRGDIPGDYSKAIEFAITEAGLTP